MYVVNSSYVAGFFDGEGCVGVYAPRSRPAVQITMSQRTRPVLDEIRKFLGYGQVRLNSGKYTLRIDGKKDVRKFIRSIYPYSIVKKDQLRMAYELTNLIHPPGYYGRGGIPEHELQRRLELQADIRGLR